MVIDIFDGYSKNLDQIEPWIFEQLQMKQNATANFRAKNAEPILRKWRTLTVKIKVVSGDGGGGVLKCITVCFENAHSTLEFSYFLIQSIQMKNIIIWFW